MSTKKLDDVNDTYNVKKTIKSSIKSSTARSNKSTKSGLKDLSKINEDPVKYARTVQIDRLVNILQKMSDHYYADSRSLVDDDVYDAMFDVLKERDPDNAYLFQTGVEKTTDKDVELPYAMPSLNKIKPGEKTLDRWFKSHKGPYTIMDKLDGISIQLYKDNHGNIDIFTKKQTGMGTSKKHLLEYLVDANVLAKLPKGCAVRGEVVISQKDFKIINKLDPDLKNPRSAMAGLINTDKIDTRIAKKAQYITYAIITPRYKISDQVAKLKSWGFKTVWHKNISYSELTKTKNNDEEENGEEDEEENGEENGEEDEEENGEENGEEDEDDDEDDTENKKNKYIQEMRFCEENLKKILTERRGLSEFLIDGLVVTDNSMIYEHNNSEPKYSMAFKMNSVSDMKDVVIEEVIWEPTMYGYLQPVIRIKPVILSGNTHVTYITAHNAKYVQDNKLAQGAIIKIVRSGEVIPYIVSVVKPAKNAAMPCIEYEWNNTNVEIIATNPSDDVLRKIRIKQNLHFFRILNVKFLSDGIIKKLYDAGYETIVSIVAAASNNNMEPQKIAGLGKTMITKIYAEINKAFAHIKLPELMAGSLKFGRGLGVRKIREIIKKYPNIIKMKNDPENKIEDKIITVQGFSQILARKFSKNLKQFCKFLDELKNNSNYDISFKFVSKNVKPVKKNNNTIHDMSNEVVVMTGFRSNEITEFIETHGGRISSGISGTTTLVLYQGDKPSSKIQKAKDKGIRLMGRDEFEKIYGL